MQGRDVSDYLIFVESFLDSDQIRVESSPDR